MSSGRRWKHSRSYQKKKKFYIIWMIFKVTKKCKLRITKTVIQSRTQEHGSDDFDGLF